MSMAQGRYPTFMVLLHWAMLLLTVAVYAAIELREFFPKGSDIREGFKAWHFMLGLTVLVRVLLRIGYWLIGLHAAAASAHHYFWNDDTLKRMLPGGADLAMLGPIQPEARQDILLPGVVGATFWGAPAMLTAMIARLVGTAI